MGVTQHLVFDPTSVDDSANVGAFVRASDGTLIDYKLISAANWLNVASALFDSTGVGITSTTVSGKQGLDVNLIDGSISVDLNGIYDVSTNPTPDNVGNILFTRAASPGLANQTFTWTGGAASSDAVVAANVHAADANSFNMLYNGTTWDRWQGTGGSANVSVTNSVTTNDAALANTAGANGASVVGVLSAALIASPLAARKYLFTFNNGNHAVFLGFGTVTTANGFPMFPGQAYEFRAGAALGVNAISGTAGMDVRTLELS